MFRLLLVTLCICLSSEGANPFSRNRPAGKPNIIFILADDLGYGDLGCYGQKQIPTPELDKMAREGMRFTQAYAGSTVCAPSRAVLMTGLHTGHARIRGNADVPLLPEDKTVAEILKEQDYVTGIFGKWGLGLEGTTGTPNKKGFDEWFGYLDQTHAHNYYPTQLWRNAEMLIVDKNAYNYRQQYSHDWFTRSALNFIRINQSKPFFLYLAYTIPHANNELGKLTGNGMEVPSDAPFTDKPWPQPEKNKAAMIGRMDNHIGIILKELKKYKIDEQTLVIFSSDNGPHNEGGSKAAFFNSSGPLRGIKRDMYEGGIRVPMIARWPKKIPAGVVSDHQFTFWDFLPTVAELTKAKVAHKVDGISYATLLQGGKQEAVERFLYWEFHEGGTKQAVRLGDWKAVRLAPEQPLELYDLANDLGEKNNIAEKNPEVVRKIENYLKTARTEHDRWPIKAPPLKPKKSA